MILKNRNKSIEEMLTLGTLIKKDFYGVPITNKTVECLLRVFQLSDFTNEKNSILFLEFLLERCYANGYSLYSNQIFNIIFNSKLSNIFKESASYKIFNFILNNESFLKDNIVQLSELSKNDIIKFFERFYDNFNNRPYVPYYENSKSQLKYDIENNNFVLNLFFCPSFEIAEDIYDDDVDYSSENTNSILTKKFASKIKIAYPDIKVYNKNEVYYAKQIILNNKDIKTILEEADDFNCNLDYMEKDVAFEVFDKLYNRVETV